MMFVRLFFSLVVVFLLKPTAVLASTDNIFNLANNDQSLFYLKWFFGDVGGVLPGQVDLQGQFIGTLMRYLNLGMLAFATLMITYTIMMGVVKTAQDAAFMGREGKSGWTAIRSALGIALLVPGVSGYSLIQVFIMWVVVQGVGLANTIYNRGSSFLDRNGIPCPAGQTCDDESSAAVNFDKLAAQVSPSQGMLPIALSNISSQLCAQYFNDIVQDSVIELKTCLQLESMQDASTGLTTGLATTSASSSTARVTSSSGGASKACDSIFTKFALGESVQQSIRSNTANILSVLNGMNNLPKVGLYLGYNSTQENNSLAKYSTQIPSNRDGVLPHAVAGIKLGTNIVAVCGVYPLGKRGLIAEAPGNFNYSQLDQQLFGLFKSFTVALRPIVNTIYNATAKVGGRLKYFKEDDLPVSFADVKDASLETSINRAIVSWRQGVRGPMTYLMNEILNSGTMGGTNNVGQTYGWVHAGGYYWALSKAERNAASSITATLQIFPLCRYITNTISPNGTDISEDRRSSGTLYPVPCSDPDSRQVVCRPQWNMPAANQNPGAAAPTPATAGNDLETREQNCSGLTTSQEFSNFLKTHFDLSTNDNIQDLLLSEDSAISSFDRYSYSVASQLDNKRNIAIRPTNETAINDSNKDASKIGDKSLYHSLVTLSVYIAGLGVALTIGAVGAGGWVGGAAAGAAVTIIVAGFSGVTDMFVDSTSKDPMTAIFNMGHALSALAIIAYMGAGAAIYFASIAAGTMNSMHGISEASKLSASWFMPLFQVVIIAALANGGMLAVYVPMIPFMIYLFAVIGWLITVLEAMVAGPLIAMGVTHPQGHDLLGKSEQATMMLISVFLRPALITIGFFASILMLRVAFYMTKAMFTPYAEYFLLSSLNPILGIAFFMTLTVIVIGVVETSFSLINVVPERVMHWIGVQGMAQDLSRATMQMAQGASKAAGQSAGESMTRQGANEEKKTLQGAQGGADAQN